MNDCRHPLLGAVRLTRCPSHSAESVSVWTWHSGPPPSATCPCEVADRFVVAEPHAADAWLRCADVVIAATTRDGPRLRYPPGCAVVASPAPGGTLTFHTPAGLLLRSELCEICVYPWLVTRLRPTPAARGQDVTGRARRRDPEPA